MGFLGDIVEKLLAGKIVIFLLAIVGIAIWLVARIERYSRRMGKLRDQIKETSHDLAQTEERIRLHTSGEEANAAVTHPCDDTIQAYRKTFLSIHPEFIINLRKTVPNITDGEENLCIFIKLNMKNKEIAQTLCIDSNTIYTFRSRLKRKLPLKEGVTMDEWIRGIE